MAGLIDVAVATERVTVQGEVFEVHGLSFGSIAKLLVRFPEFGKIAQGGSFDFASLATLGPEFIAAFLSAGLDPNWIPEVEKVVGALPIDEQMQIFVAILKVSMPRGVGPFVETIATAAKLLGLTSPAPSDGSQKASSTRRQRS